MRSATYHDLREFGLEFVIPGDSEFSGLVEEIQSRPQPLGRLAVVKPDSPAAVLLNRSGKAIIALAYVWRHTMEDGQVRKSQHSNLGSSTQMDVLTGRAGVARDGYSFILPGSKRLITEDGMFGDNFDVLPPESRPIGGGFVGTGAGGRSYGVDQEVTAIELELDVVFLEDGLCVGADEFGLFESLTAELEEQRKVAGEIADALRRGESVGRAFEMLLPMARQTVRRRHSSPMQSMFARTAIHQLINMSGPELVEWFEVSARPSGMTLHRAADAG